MTPDTLTDEVRHFLNAHVASLEDLGTLVALIEGDGRWWDEHTMATHVGISPDDARRALDGFVSKNLLDVRIFNDVRYRLNPGSEDLTSDLHAFAAAYRRVPAAIILWAARRTARRMADTADAVRVENR